MPRFSRSQGLRFHLKDEMSVPGQSNQAGGPDQMIVNEVPIPEEATGSETGGQVLNIMAEVPLSNTIGIYRFDFTRLLARTLGAADFNMGIYPQTLLGMFRQIRFGKGHMKITRVDTGNVGLIQVPGAEPALLPFNAGKPVPLKIHYIRLSSHEPSWSEILLDPRRFMASPRKRTVTLMPNRSVTFSFTPVKFRPPNYLAHTIRDYANTLSQEQEQYRRVELPSRSSRLGWIPTSFAGYIGYVPVGATANVAGLGASNWRVVSTSIAFCFEIPANGTFLYPSGIPLVPQTTYVGDLTRATIRRNETCTVHLRGIQDTILAQSSYGGSSYSGVGKIYTTHAWNSTGGFTFTPNIIELFDPPRFNSISLDPIAASTPGPLWRYPEAESVFRATEVPMDTQLPLLRSAGSVPPVPPGDGTLP